VASLIDFVRPYPLRLAVIGCLVIAVLSGCGPGETQVTVRNEFGTDIYVVFMPDSTEPPQAFHVGNATSTLTLADSHEWTGRAIVYAVPGCRPIAELPITPGRVLLLASAEGGVGVGTSDDSASPAARVEALSALPC
jgi:hypothetical protein